MDSSHSGLHFSSKEPRASTRSTLCPLGRSSRWPGGLFSTSGWATWKPSNRTFMVILSQLCNVVGYSLQYVFVCPLVFNLTYLPYAPMSIGISIMCGQGAQWIFQTLVLGPAEKRRKAEIADFKARGLVRKFGWKQEEGMA